MGKIIGVDLGTTFSAVCIMDGKEPKVIVNSEGARTTPSVVGYSENGDILVGQLAKRQAVMNPENTVYSAKRFIGMPFDQSAADIAKVPYKVERAANGDCAINIRGKKLSPPEVSAKVLQKLKSAAEDYLGETVTDIVCTVPAYFGDSARQATKDACRIAGLNCLRIINEPTAAALAYGLDKTGSSTCLVWDCGGGTHDISVLEIGDGVVQVISTSGDTHLGGDDVDNMIIDWLLTEFKKDSGIDLSKDKTALQRLKDSSEQAKIELSNAQETTISLPFLTMDASGPKHLQKTLSRAKLEQMIAPLVVRTMEPVKKALADAGKQPSDIDNIILVGGTSRIPCMQEAVKKFFGGKEPHKGVNPDEIVAIGAAVQASILGGEKHDIVLLDVTPLSLCIETLGGVSHVLIPRNTTIPTSKEDTFSTAQDGQSSVSVVVAQGERKFVKDNRVLGRLNLDGIMPAPRGVPKICVEFSVSAEGLLSVTATDKATGKSQKAAIQASGGLSEAEIKRMVDEAAANAADDDKRKDEVEQRNKLDNLCHSVEKTIFDNKDKVSEADRESVGKIIAEARAAIEKQDSEAVKTLQASLEAESFRISTALYNAAQAEPQGEAAQPQQEVKDAEFTETPVN